MQANGLEYKQIESIVKKSSHEDIAVLDPNILIGVLKRHRVFSWFGNYPSEIQNGILRKSIREEINSSSLKSLKITGVLVEVTGHLSLVGTEVISIKGPVLAQTLFGDVGKRHFGDLDLVVKREDVWKVVGILEGQGYKMISPKPGLTEKQWDYYFKYKKDVGLVNREKGVVIELHVGVYRHELLKIEDEGMLWEDLEEVKIGGTPIKTMNKDNTFLYLLYHGGQHLYFRLFWLRDVAEAMKRWDLDHQKVLDDSFSMGIDRMVGLGILLANELFDVPIPEIYDEYLDQNKKILGKLKRMCLMKIYGPENDTFIFKLRRYRYNLMLKAGFKYKWAVIASAYHRWYIKKYLGGH